MAEDVAYALAARHLEDFALDAQFVSGPHRQRPAQLLEAGADDPAGGFIFALYQQPRR